MIKWKSLSAKIIIAISVCAIFAFVLMLSTKALATTNESNNLNDTAKISFETPSPDSGTLVLKDNASSFDIEKGSTLYSPASKDGIGRMYLGDERPENLLATFYPSYTKVFEEWHYPFKPKLQDNNDLNEEQSIQVNTDIEFSVITDDNKYPDNTGTLTGFVGTGTSETDIVPLADYKVYFKAHTGEEYVTYTDVNGHFRLNGIPFGKMGALNGYKEGYVSDYSNAFELGTTGQLTRGIDMGTVMVTRGVNVNVLNNLDNQDFNISKWYISLLMPPQINQLAEEYTAPSFSNKQFPEGAYLRVMKDPETINLKDGGTRTFNPGTLVYHYICTWGGIVGGIRYEVYIEPATNSDPYVWTYINSLHNKELVPVLSRDDEESGVKINLAEGDYAFNLDPIPVTPPSPSQPEVAAQTGDSLMPIVISLLVVICACGGFVAYRKIKKNSIY